MTTKQALKEWNKKEYLMNKYFCKDQKVTNHDKKYAKKLAKMIKKKHPDMKMVGSREDIKEVEKRLRKYKLQKKLGEIIEFIKGVFKR